MANPVVRKFYDWGPTQWFLTTTGLDYHVRLFYTRFQEIRQGTTVFTVNNTSVEVSKRTIPDRDYLKPERAVLEDLLGEMQPDDIFWDIGADKGLYTCPIGKHISEGSLIAFEPHPIRRGELKRNLKRNNITAELRTEALSDTVSEAEFGGRIEPGGEGGEFTAKLMKGDKIITENSVKSPNIIKIDVEGAELDVLGGLDETLRQDDCRLIYIELHNRISDFGGTWEELKNHLCERNFTIETVTERIGEDFKQPYLKAKRQM